MHDDYNAPARLLISAAAWASKSSPGWEGFYRRLEFERMLTAMAIFEDQVAAFERGYLSPT